jgi:general secretion pathway protein I
MRKHSRGFTLIEVLVALAVLAIALAAVMRVVAQSGDTAIALRDRTQAMWVAQDRLREHQLQRDWPAADTRSGVSQFAGREWQWREQVIVTPLKELRRVEIDISAGEGRETLAHLVGFLRDPQS